MNIFLIGCGGTGMSWLWHMFLDMGYTNIIGVDPQTSDLTERLRLRWMHHITTHGELLPQAGDVVIYSAAADQAPEVVHARKEAHHNPKRPTLILNYFGFLGEISKYFTTIAIAGTHGKSTTTAFLGRAMSETHPLFGCAILWAWMPARDGKNSRINPTHLHDMTCIFDHILGVHNKDRYPLLKRYYFVVEACEYHQHFLELDVDYSIVTNMELDHADVYDDYTAYTTSFATYVDRVTHTVRMPPASPGFTDLEHALHHQTLTPVPSRTFSFRSIIGAHNHVNASCALAVLEHLDPTSAHLTSQTAYTSYHEMLEQFGGLRRRAEILGRTPSWALVVSDYAHHPTELSSSIAWLREAYPDKRIQYIFQPHQARRVLEFWQAFMDVLGDVDDPIIYDIYAAREHLTELLRDIHVPDLDTVAKITDVHQLGQLFAQHAWWTYIATRDALYTQIQSYGEDDLVVLFTAGNMDYLVRSSPLFQ